MRNTERGGREQKINMRVVHTVQELVEASASPDVLEIRLSQDLNQVPPLRLSPGQSLNGFGERFPTLSFDGGSDGLELTADNQIRHLRLHTEPQRNAIWTSPNALTFGHVVLEGVETNGRVAIILEKQQGLARLEVRGLHIGAADATSAEDRPSGFGVSVLQGAFTLWNKRPGKDGEMTADLLDLAVGRRGAPVVGSGIFVCGAAHDDVSLHVDRLRTKEVYSKGEIAEGTADLISGGVFIVHGVSADVVENFGPVMTFGANDMALDSWGVVDRWVAHDKVTTFGASAIGFVNFGMLNQLLVRAAIETHGTGARGYNVYSGTVRRASFDRISTHGDGAVGVQLSQPVGTLRVRRGIETHGGKGQSLVKGVLQELNAVALSIKNGGRAELIVIRGGIFTHGQDTPALEQEGEIARLQVTGGFGNRYK